VEIAGDSAGNWIRRFVIDRSDPTCLGTVLALLLMTLAQQPWVYSDVRPRLDDGWIGTIWAQALAVMVLSPFRLRTVVTFVAVSIVTVPSLQVPPFEGHNWTLYALPRLLWRCDLGEIGLFGAQLVMLLVFIGRSHASRRDWLTIGTAAVLALSISFGVWMETPWGPRIIALGTPLPWRILQILHFLTPAIALPILFWSLLRAMKVAPRWLVTCSTILGAFVITRVHRPTDASDWVALFLIASAGHVAAAIDRWKNPEHAARGFEVILID
jgi:hypothetical protein